MLSQALFSACQKFKFETAHPYGFDGPRFERVLEEMIGHCDGVLSDESKMKLRTKVVLKIKRESLRFRDRQLVAARLERGNYSEAQDDIGDLVFAVKDQERCYPPAQWLELGRDEQMQRLWDKGRKILVESIQESWNE